MRRGSLAIVMVAVVAATACVPPEQDDDVVTRFDDTTVMGRIQQRGVLRVGLPEELDGSPWHRSAGGRGEGFLVELAELVADSLGVGTTYRVAATSVLLAMVTPPEDDPATEEVESIADTGLDLVFPKVAITEEAAKAHTFADPYWVSHQRVLLIPGRHGPPGRPVCSHIDPVTGAPIDDLGMGPLEEVEEPMDCARLLEGGAQAAVAPDVDLVAIAAVLGHRWKVAPSQMTTAGYGPAVRTGATQFARIVSQVIEEAIDEGDWGRFFDEWLADFFIEPVPPPLLSAEDAAALWPQG